MPETNDKMDSVSNLTIDHQIALLEQDRATPLTAEQRDHLPGKLSGLAESLHAMRAFHLMDGGTEPGVVFRPLPAEHTPAVLVGIGQDEIGMETPHG